MSPSARLWLSGVLLLCLSSFPFSHSTFAVYSDGRFTTGNKFEKQFVFEIDKRRLAANDEFLNDAY